MIIGNLVLLMQIIPHTFGDKIFIIESEEKELMRFPDTLNRDLMVCLPDKEDRRLELIALIKNTIGDGFDLDIEGVVDIIMAR